MNFVAAVPYTIPVAYLAAVCAMRAITGRVPWWLHPVLAVALLPLQVYLSGPLAVAVAAGVAAVMFCLLTLVGARMLSGVSVLSLATAILVGPADGFLGVTVGVFVAGLAGAVSTAMVAGRGRVSMVVHSTLLAMGVSPGGFTRPSPGMLPQASDVDQVIKTDRDGRRMRMFYPAYLFVGTVGYMAYVAVTR